MSDERNPSVTYPLTPMNISGITYASAFAAAVMVLPISSTPAFAQSKTVAAAKAAPANMLSYRMKRGDNLYTLADKYMIRVGAASEVQRLNRIANPREIPVGTPIRIPVRLLKYKPQTARILAWRGAVSLNNDRAPAVGMQLAEGSNILTGQGGFLTLVLSNGSRVSIPSQSAIRISRLREYVITDDLDYELSLDKGRVQTKAAPFKNPGSRYRIRTPVAVSAVRGTEFRVNMEESNTPSLTEVLQGTVAVTPEATASVETLVPQGSGIAVRKDGSILTEALLAAPELTNPGKVQNEEALVFTVSPVAGATRYRGVVATDASMIEQIQEIVTSTPSLSFTAIPDGQYFIRVSALSPEGLEGMPSNYGFSRRFLTTTGGATPAPDGSVVFKWDVSGNGKIVSRFQLYRDALTTTPYIDEAGIMTDHIKLDTLPPGNWVWRVGVSAFNKGTVTENWAPPEKLIIAREE